MNQLLKKNSIDSQELELLLGLRALGELEFLLVDVRELHEFQNSHILGVDSLMQGSEVFMWVDEFCESHRDKTVILTCRTGMRSSRLQRFLIQKGLGSVINHAGGIVSYHGKINRNQKELS